MPEHAVPADLDGERADKAVAILGELSRADARKLFDLGEVRLGGAPIEPKRRVRQGDTLEFEQPAAAPGLVAEPVDFGVRYEDQHLIVVDKPAGVVVHPGGRARGGTLAAGIIDRYPEIVGVGDPDRWGLVHRLDRDTSGLLLVARTAEAYAALKGAIARRDVHRRYLALVDGLFDAPLGTIDAPIATDPVHATRRIVSTWGRPSRTHYRRTAQWAEESVSLLEVDLETGRTHQIRVHLAAIDHPVIGDRWYGRPCRVDSPRVFLHAVRLELEHPVGGEHLVFESPLPADLDGVLRRLGPPD